MKYLEEISITESVAVHTPTVYNGDDCLNRRWAEVVQKLTHFAQNNSEESR